jgi:hypothetical protein
VSFAELRQLLDGGLVTREALGRVLDQRAGCLEPGFRCRDAFAVGGVLRLDRPLPGSPQRLLERPAERLRVLRELGGLLADRLRPVAEVLGLEGQLLALLLQVRDQRGEFAVDGLGEFADRAGVVAVSSVPFECRVVDRAGDHHALEAELHPTIPGMDRHRPVVEAQSDDVVAILADAVARGPLLVGGVDERDGIVELGVGTAPSVGDSDDDGVVAGVDRRLELREAGVDLLAVDSVDGSPDGDVRLLRELGDAVPLLCVGGAGQAEDGGQRDRQPEASMGHR